jgi:hypothetical protein
MCVSTTGSPATRLARAQAWATRFVASVVLRVKITSLVEGALMNRAVLARASS